MTINADLVAEALARALGDDFALVREIGRGGMGLVFLARDLHLQRDVAVKTLPPQLAADEAVRARFLREARTAAALSHPNIIPIYSAAERNGVVYFTMAYVDGVSLAERVARDGPLSFGAVITLLDELASALGAAHARGVVHRDVKAENVLLDRRAGHAIVTDFGIARVAETQSLTATGTVLGTVHYMSPEQVRGVALDGRSDLYALGVLAFFALTGRFPFERPNASAVVVAHVNDPAPHVTDSLPHCPPALDALIARLLAKSPAERFQDAEELRTALQTTALREVRAPLDMVGPVPSAEAREAQRLSSTEAAAVWSRAAELQANTGMIVPPPSFAPRSEQPQVTSGYDAALIKASAVEAGIDEKYVVRALQEQQYPAAVIENGPAMQSGPSMLAGAFLKFEYIATSIGELDASAFDDIADDVRKALGEIVSVSVVGTTLTVETAAMATHGASQRKVHVRVASKNGRTTFRAFEDMEPIAAALHMTWGIGVGVGCGILLAAWVARLADGSGIAAILTLLVAMFGSHVAARIMLLRIVRSRSRELRATLQKIITQAEESMTVRRLR